MFRLVWLLLGCLVLGSTGCTPKTAVPLQRANPTPLRFGQLGAALPSPIKATAAATVQVPRRRVTPTMGLAQLKQSSEAAMVPVPRRRVTPPPLPPSLWRRPPRAPAIDAALEIQVAIAEGVDRMTIGMSTPGQVLSRTGAILHQLTPQQAYSVTASGDTILLGDWQLPTGTWLQPVPGGYFSVGDRAYRGRLLLLAARGQLLAVNYVLLQDYLTSVVGSEMPPTWPQEALKAQAVAARSYALTYYFKPANRAYYLGDTESYQVYSGITKEAETTRQAVKATAGEFLSYQGGIVESLYAASDDLVAIAHGGRGMSQLGALQLAEQGQSYPQILATYYPGTRIARIALDQD